MICAPRAGRRHAVALVILVGMGLGLSSETAPGILIGPTDLERSDAILRYIADINPDAPLGKLRAYPMALLAGSREHGLDHCFLLAQAEVESHFRPGAVGGAGEIGLHQILPSTARALGWKPHELYDPRVNTKVALVYLSDILARRPALRDALAEYNGGPRNRSPYYALAVLETYASVLRHHQDLGCAPHLNPQFEAPRRGPLLTRARATVRP